MDNRLWAIEKLYHIQLLKPNPHRLSLKEFFMECYTVCNARYSGKRQCHRCKAEIGILVDIGESADSYQQKTVAAYHAEDYPRCWTMPGAAAPFERRRKQSD
jgi:hypothetical protein